MAHKPSMLVKRMHELLPADAVQTLESAFATIEEETSAKATKPVRRKTSARRKVSSRRKRR